MLPHSTRSCWPSRIECHSFTARAETLVSAWSIVVATKFDGGRFSTGSAPPAPAPTIFAVRDVSVESSMVQYGEDVRSSISFSKASRLLPRVTRPFHHMIIE